MNGKMAMLNSWDDINTTFRDTGYVVLNTGVIEEWIVDLVSRQFGNIRGGVFWEKYFEVKFNPEALSQSKSIALSATDFPLHTDGSFEITPPSCFALHCVQNDLPGYGVSLLVDGWEVIQRLSLEFRSVLLETPFHFNRAEKGKESNSTAPILEQQENHYRIRYRNDHNFSLIAPTQAASIALNEVKEILKLSELRKEIYLNPGDILIVNNHRMLHGRTALSGHQPRQLRRLWIE